MRWLTCKNLEAIILARDEVFGGERRGVFTQPNLEVVVRLVGFGAAVRVLPGFAPVELVTEQLSVDPLRRAPSDYDPVLQS